MARIRTIKPEFFTDEKIADCSVPARLLFIGLWVFADDDGRMEYSPKRIAMQVFPGESSDTLKLLAELIKHLLVRIYEVDGKSYLCIPQFDKHQKMRRKLPSRYPAPQERVSDVPPIPEIVRHADALFRPVVEVEPEVVPGPEPDKKQKQKGATRPVFVVPEWVPMENWQGYIEMRQRINKPMTERAKKFAVNCLRDLLARGHPPGAVLDQSVFQSWQGLFELRGENERRPNTNSGTNQQTRQPSVAVLRYANNDTEIERFQRARAAAVGSNHPTNGSGQTPRLGTGELGLLGEKANKLS